MDLRRKIRLGLLRLARKMGRPKRDRITTQTPFGPTTTAGMERIFAEERRVEEAIDRMASPRFTLAEEGSVLDNTGVLHGIGTPGGITAFADTTLSAYPATMTTFQVGVGTTIRYDRDLGTWEEVPAAPGWDSTDFE